MVPQKINLSEEKEHPEKKEPGKPGNWKRELRILNIITFIIILAAVVSAGYFVLEPDPRDTSVGQSAVNPEDDFFDSPAVYYIKTADRDDYLREYIENNMRSLKMDKKSVEKFSNPLNLTESFENMGNAKQYFFYKTSDGTVYTSVKSKEEIEVPPTPERIEIRILEARNPNKFWGIFQLEKDTANDLQYTLTYMVGKFNKDTGRPRSYRHLELNSKRKSLDMIIKVFAEAIYVTINQNPKNALRNGEVLTFEFYLSRKKENEEYPKVKIASLSIPLKEKTQEFVKKDKVISKELKVITYWIDEDRKTTLERELKNAFDDLFSHEFHPTKVTTYKLDFYKDGKSISEPGDYSLGRINELLESNDNNSFQEWLKIFASELDHIKLYNLIEYIKNQSNKLNKKKITWIVIKRKLLSPEVLYTIIFMVIVIFVYFVTRDEIIPKEKKDESKPIKKRDMWIKFVKGEKLEDLELREIGPGITRTFPEKKEIVPETREVTIDKETGKSELPKEEPVKFHSITAKQFIIKEIASYLTKLKQIAIERFTDPVYNKFETVAERNQFKLNFDNLNVAENLAKEMLEIEPEETNQELFDSKSNQLQHILIKFRESNKISEIDVVLEEIEKELLRITSPDQPNEKPIPLPHVPETITKPTTTSTEQILTGIKNDIKNLKDRVIKALKEFTQSHGQYRDIIKKVKHSVSKEDQSLSDEEFIVKILKSLNENNQMLGNYLEKAMHDSRKNEHQLNQLLIYINKETNLLVNKSNALEIIDKVSNEPKMSKEYRWCAVKLYEELTEFEREHQNNWYCHLLVDGLLSKLRENIDFFSLKNEGARTIYDRHLKKGIPLRDIQRKDIKKIIEQHHWVQIWNGLIRMSDFFNVYFDKEMVDIKFLLGYYSQKIKEILERLGYEVNHIKPLALITNDYLKQKDFVQIDKSYFEKFIIKNLVKSGNKKFLEAVENIPDDREMVVYVERLGLVDKLVEKPVTISRLQFGAYNQDILHSYISSLDNSTD